MNARRNQNTESKKRNTREIPLFPHLLRSSPQKSSPAFLYWKISLRSFSSFRKHWGKSLPPVLSEAEVSRQRMGEMRDQSTSRCLYVVFCILLAAEMLRLGSAQEMVRPALLILVLQLTNHSSQRPFH